MIMMKYSIPVLAIICAAIITVVQGHGDHSSHGQKPDDWSEWHLQEEHHIDNFDARSFFTLHDFNSDGYWTADEVYKFYGFHDESTNDTPVDKKWDLVNSIFTMFDAGDTGHISRDAYLDFINRGKRLPDFGLGPGHHGDDEYEYEIHHFEKFHGEDATEEELTHPEDIAHFKKHDQMEDEQLRVEQEQSQPIVEANIPQKFLRHQ